MPVTVCNYIREPASGGKFVVLRPRTADDSGIVVFSDFTLDFQHRDIVSRWESRNKATLAASNMTVAGGGWWKYDDGGTLVLYGQSAAYGRFDPLWMRTHLRPGMVRHEKDIDVR